MTSICIFCLLIPNQIVGTIAAVGARMSIIGAFTIIWIYTPESYPTSIRTTALGIATCVAKVAAVITPYISIDSLPLIAPICIYGAFALVAGGAAFFFTDGNNWLCVARNNKVFIS